MTARTYLVSDSAKEFCELGKIVFDDDLTAFVKGETTMAMGSELVERLRLVVSVDALSSGVEISPEAVEKAARAIAEWIVAHPDWRFVSEPEEGLDICLANNEQEAAAWASDNDYVFDGLYHKTGTAWPSAEERS